VIWTDNLQLWILLGGGLAIPIYVGAGHRIGSPRRCSTPSVRDARRSAWVHALFKMVFTLCLVLCALALFACYAHQSSQPIQAFQQEIAEPADRVMPKFIAEVLPQGVSGLLLAALLAAATSSLSSAIDSISSVVSIDFLARFSLRASPDHLRVDKSVSVIAGAISILTGLSIAAALKRADWNLVEITNGVNTVLVGPMGALFFAGMLFRRVGSGAAMAGFLVGAFMSVFTSFGKEWFGLARSISFVWVVPSRLVFGLAAACLAGRRQH
jgi:SSS family solute:Na+ symporter